MAVDFLLHPDQSRSSCTSATITAGMNAASRAAACQPAPTATGRNHDVEGRNRKRWRQLLRQAITKGLMEPSCVPQGVPRHSRGGQVPGSCDCCSRGKCSLASPNEGFWKFDPVRRPEARQAKFLTVAVPGLPKNRRKDHRRLPSSRVASSDGVDLGDPVLSTHAADHPLPRDSGECLPRHELALLDSLGELRDVET